MHLLTASLSRGGWRRHAWTVLGVMTVALVFTTLIDLSSVVPWRRQPPNLQQFPAAPLASACDSLANLDPTSLRAADAPIPNLVHYIWLLANPPVFSLSFKVFVSVYSAHLPLGARKDLCDLWTKRVLNLPGVMPNFIDNPRLTTQGVDIDTFGAKSDFIRADALRTYGGIYLDVDAIPLRDIAPLRNAGFANVVGRAVAMRTKYTGFVNTGVWLSRPHSNLAEIFFTAMDAFYNGVWAISVDILTDLAFRLHAVPGEVLIVHPRAFAPASWELEDQVRLFQPHIETKRTSSAAVLDRHEGAAAAMLPSELRNTCQDALAWLAEREKKGRVESWEIDFSATYVLHAFDDYADQIQGWDGNITLQYVLARQSNYARAVFPAVSHAVQAGIISKEEAL
ncbi:glycosyltransferase family 32 protein [Parathielavia appendiculata]|uniref:Glycosyltransferase family 32 protein n=1 Tax=Parathielavia appendiculata TaxID=2587402 RepID=A0AAN6U5S2_9PEZI|nr:glycosyltransferase family 32 protein [Parathielavia appendiculata]